MLKLREVIWKMQFIEKISVKHCVTTDEVESVIFEKPLILRVRRGNVKGEDVHEALGQTHSGRFLAVFFIHKDGAALSISARDMTRSERRYYEDQKG